VSPGLAIDFLNHAIMLCLMAAAPLLITALAVGVLVSIVQAVTQIQEQTLTFIPKLIAVALVFIVAMPWMMRQLVGYFVEILRSLPGLAA
jgi:flagellar biosynthetic protein FliQ